MSDKLKLGGIMYHITTGGPWVTTEVFVKGCLKNCKGCFNQTLRSFDEPYRLMEPSELADILIEHVPYKRVTISGGEPMLQARLLADLARQLKDNGFTILCYTGYTLEELLAGTVPELDVEAVRTFLRYVDILVDGEFDISKKLEIGNFKFIGSSNQRMIDMKRTLAGDGVVLWDQVEPM